MFKLQLKQIQQIKRFAKAASQCGHWPSFLSCSSRWQNFCRQFLFPTGTYDREAFRAITRALALQQCSEQGAGSVSFVSHGCFWQHTHVALLKPTYSLPAMFFRKSITSRNRSNKWFTRQFCHSLIFMLRKHTGVNLHSQTSRPFWNEAEKKIRWVKIQIRSHIQDILAFMNS